MRDGLKIYACSGFGVGTAPAEFTYWLDNTDTLTNTCAVNSLLADINFIAAKLKYDTLTGDEMMTALNMIDLYTVCLYGAEQYKGRELERYGRIVAQMVEDGAFTFGSTDNTERDTNLDDLISIANTRFADGEDYEIQNDTLQWFNSHVVALDYVGLSDKQIADVRAAIDGAAGIAGTTSQDAAVALNDAGAYYLYLYMSPNQAKRIGKVVDAKRKKQQEVYNYTLAAYTELYGSEEAVNKNIYAGICKRYNTTPEAVIDDILKGNKPKGIGITIEVIIGIIASIVTILATIISTVLSICGASLQSKYTEPSDPDFGTPGLGGEDVNEIQGYWAEHGEDTKGVLGILAAIGLILYGIFKK